ncbi:hypothetical protein HNP37_000741 [Flavobacterium nitrogenifigens]|uniref:Uncharacterized protein n=2 Tax=Flavobacterium TaxID=237 RepID=A0A7W7N6X8_9FLAO|nr:MULTISPECIES: hypothetical protein [Flavobacterium]MBB4800702.1 hypothetical protein [Flavobacterium nitrogenifigens]MBB6385551.1 hypothetical protein [Flavobacterium notoginsengisoli]
MKTENNAILSQNNVLESLYQFVSDICFEGEFKNYPNYLTEIFEHILETETGNNLRLRTKMLSCIKTSKMLAKALEPFSEEQIEEAFSVIRNA